MREYPPKIHIGPMFAKLPPHSRDGEVCILAAI